MLTYECILLHSTISNVCQWNWKSFQPKLYKKNNLEFVKPWLVVEIKQDTRSRVSGWWKQDTTLTWSISTTTTTTTAASNSLKVVLVVDKDSCPGWWKPDLGVVQCRTTGPPHQVLGIRTFRDGQHSRYSLNYHSIFGTFLKTFLKIYFINIHDHLRPNYLWYITWSVRTLRLSSSWVKFLLLGQLLHYHPTPSLSPIASHSNLNSFDKFWRGS